MNNPSHEHKRRWYDDIGEVTMALHISRQLPTEIQQLIARSLNEAIDEHRRIRRNDKNAVSLGRHRTLGLYQASNRKRWYDPQPDLHRAFNLMTTVPHDYLSEFANRVLHVGHYLAEQQEYGNYGERYLLADTVQSILQHGRRDDVHLEAHEDGIRLVSHHRQTGPTTPRHRPHNPR